MRILLIFVALLTLSSRALAIQPHGERILSYHSDILVRKDGTMLVNETIQVRSQGIDIRRGIYRSFPVKYRDRMGNNVEVRFHVERVTRDGRDEPFHTKREGRNINVYVGSADVFLSPGEYTYEITYSTNRQLGFYQEYDELYWNAIATGWAFPIDEGSARIQLPEEAEITQFMGYSGPEGATGCDCEIAQTRSNELVVHMTRPLQAYEGLTVAVAWPKGIVSPSSMEDRLGWFFSDNRAALLGLVGLVLVFLYYMYAWNQVGKDPTKGTIVPLFETPEGLSPAAARFIMEMGFDNKAFASSVVNMAVKGVLKITEKKKVYTLHKISEDLHKLSNAERKLLNVLFRGGQKSIELTNKKHATIKAAVDALKGSLTTEFHKKYFNLNRKWLIPGVVLTVITLASMLLTSRFDTGGEDFGILLWLSIWTVACTGLIIGTVIAWRNVMINGRSQIGGALFMTLFSVPFLGAEVAVLLFSGVSIPLVLIFIGILLLLVNVLFYHWLEAPTLFGRQIMDKIEGFRTYLSTAEKHRMDLLNPPERTPELFEKMLPYAIALDVANKWGEQFEDILNSSQRAPGESATYQPVWYTGSHSWSDIGSTRLANNLSSSFTSAVSRSSTPPGSGSGSGGGFSGGGGSSGGGGGGGGGGGW